MEKRQFASIALGLGLIISLLPKTHQRAKVDISEVLTIVWLFYSLYYKDYFVMVFCILILIYSFSQSSEEQVMVWP
jgi:hypothetical protein